MPATFDRRADGTFPFLDRGFPPQIGFMTKACDRRATSSKNLRIGHRLSRMLSGLPKRAMLDEDVALRAPATARVDFARTDRERVGRGDVHGNLPADRVQSSLSPVDFNATRTPSLPMPSPAALCT